MPHYEICYTDRQGALVGKISAGCSNATQAAIFAHAMKFREWLKVEVWEGETLIYERPMSLPMMRRPVNHASHLPSPKTLELAGSLT
jgi:hypothetical protein